MKAEDWIKVEDRLPTSEDLVLIRCGEVIGDEIADLIDVSYCIDGAWTNKGLHGLEPTHWMPIVVPIERNHSPKGSNNTFTKLRQVAIDMFGPEVIGKSRRKDHIMGRRCIAYKMRLEGFTLNTIARKLNRGHCAVLNMCRMMEDAIKFDFRDEVDIWNEFLSKVQER